MSVAVIGNGSQKQSNGGKINGYSTVIRMGKCIVDEYENYIGTKTDIISNGISVLKLWRYIDPYKPYNVPVWIMVPDVESCIEGTDYEISYCNAWRDIMFTNRQPSKDIHDDKLATLKERNNVIQLTWSDVICSIRELNFELHNIPITGTLVRPTLGFLTVQRAIKHFKNIDLFGFDFFQSGVYWDDNHKHAYGKHNILLEKIKLKTWDRKGRATLL